MGIVRILDDHIANQIAAGEVVERPASVVKELVENAIDAGSTRVDVTVEEGGLQLIRITDNGSGIQPDDLEIAFQRHATSKISSGKDLFQIRTLGFRGEALPSISAVAKVECVSASDNSGLGRRMVVEGGSVKALEDTATARGTDIQVKELFYNTPARLKYMKTIQTELGHISDYMYRLALSRPTIAFSLKHNGSQLLQTLGNGDLLQVIAGIYGTATAKQMLAIQAENPDYRIKGFLSKPELTRSNRMGVSVVINGRYIRNYGISQALLKAYHTLLPLNRYPLAVLHFDMDPALLDVNVHPSKLEVRFSKEAELVELLEKAARTALNRESHIPNGSRSATAVKPAVVQEKLELYRPEPSTGFMPSSKSYDGFGNRESLAAPQAGEDPLWKSEGLQEAAAAASGASRSDEPNLTVEKQPYYSPDKGSTNRDKPAPSEKPLPPQAAQKVLEALEPPATQDEAPPGLPKFPMLEPIGQLHGTYIVAQNETGLYLIDQHAAHERIHYEYYFELFGRPAEASQELLVPITLEYTPSEAELLKTRLMYLEQVGVILEPFGGHTFLVRAYPHWFPQGEEQTIIDEMTEWVLGEKRSIDLAKLREKASTLCSCKASIKANQSLTKVEMEGLLDRLARCRIPYTCPHGRPIVISFSTYELEKMFKRVM